MSILNPERGAEFADKGPRDNEAEATESISDPEESPTERQRAVAAKPKKKITPFKPDHQRAAAKIYIDGLSILCFDDKQSQFVFVKDGHTAIQLRFYNSAGAEVHPPYSPPDETRVRINIKRWKTGTQHSPGEFYEEGDSRSDDEDFRWLPDICDWYSKEGVKFRNRDNMAKNHLSAKLVIQDAVFYTRVKSTKKAKLVNWTLGERKDYVARIVGADIFCDDTDQGISIEITGRRDPIRLPRLTRGQYYILAETHPTAEHLRHGNPMPAVYDHIIEPPAFRRYHLEFEDEERELEFEPSTDTFRRVMRATEYACQSHGGGNGDPPDIP